MRRFFRTLRTVILLVVLAGIVAGGVYGYLKYAPSGEWADREAWYGAGGDVAALFWNDELLEDVQGRFADGQAYLPASWVSDSLNEKFYWDEAGCQMIYALPESIVYVDTSMTGSDGSPLLLVEDGEVWYSIGLVETYTDVRIEAFADGDVKRIYVDDGWGSERVAKLKWKGKIRIRGGFKSPILAEAEKGDEVTVLETLKSWSRVRTRDGYVGYVYSRLLGDEQEYTQISRFIEPVYTKLSMDEPICMVWHQVTTAEANSGMEKLMENTSGVNVIAPTWFMLTDNEGTYASFADSSYVDRAHEMGLQVWAVLDNFNQGSMVQSEILFASTEARKRLIAGLMEDVETYGIDGLNLDIESIRPEAGPHYVQFIRELAADCRKNGIFLSVDTYVPTAYTMFYNRAEQGRVADYVVIMGYDEHYAGGEAGSVASLGYERQGIENTLTEVAHDRIISAIPFYTRVWKEDGTEQSSVALGIRAAKEWVEKNEVELVWQEESGQYYGEKTLDGTFCRIWMEEERSLGLKMDLIREYDLAGVACWKLGFEPADIWEVVKLP
ncbi:MAG: glycosyl hydrolase family 18 protein [Clostridiales bacterium]|nr:glycosyl hydrolase family 18 protein [Clostridiales bacterium]